MTPPNLDELPDDHDINHLRGALRELGSFHIAVDGGAHRGIWTNILCEKFTQCYAFEANKDNYKKIEKQDNCVLYQAALGEGYYRAGLALGPDNTGQSHIVEGDDIQVIPLDSFGLQHLDFLKLDVEGYELRALQGAAMTIISSKPAIMVELNGLSERYGNTDEDVIEWLTDRKYKEVGRWNKDYLFCL